MLGAGGGGVVYLLEQQAPGSNAHPQRVAMKVTYEDNMHSILQERNLALSLRPGLPNVVELLGVARGSIGERVVFGLVYEFCPGKNLRSWAAEQLLLAAQQPQMQQQHAAAVEAVMAQAHLDWAIPEDWEEQLCFRNHEEESAFYVTQATPLRQLVLEGQLKRHMRQLMGLLVQMNNSNDTGSGSSSSNSNPSAIVDSKGAMLHSDIKSENVYMAANGAAKLGDWGSAVRIPDASSQQPLPRAGFTIR